MSPALMAGTDKEDVDDQQNTDTDTDNDAHVWDGRRTETMK